MLNKKSVLAVILIFALALGTFMIPSLAADGLTILARDAQWKFFDQGKLDGDGWKAADFDDSSWAEGKAPLGFGDEISETDPSVLLGTTVGFGGDEANKYLTTYFRTTIEVPDLSAYSELQVYVHVDDGCVVYVNGVEAFRRGIDDGVTVAYETSAKFKPKQETFAIPASLFTTGKNVLAAEVHQDDGESSDLWFELGVTAPAETESAAAPAVEPAAAPAADQAVLARNATWKFYDQGQLDGDAWKTADFDDSNWAEGVSPLGFGDETSETDPTLPIGTVVGYGGDGANKYMTTYFRTTVEVPDLSAYPNLEVYIHVDDGCVVYVNGVEAFRKGIEDGAVAYDTAAKFKPKEETFTVPASLLAKGKNVLAAEVHQDGGDSSDLWFELGITASSGAKAEAAAAQVIVPDPNAPIGAVTKVTVTFAGDAKTAKGFTWYTTLASAGSDVQVVEKAEGEPDFANAEKFIGRYQVSTNSPAEVVHKAEAVGLKPDTAYFFRVGDEALNLWSGTGSFETAADGAFTFIDLADSQAKNEEEAILAAHTFQKAAETVEDADFTIINGDIVDTGLNEAQWDWLLGHSQDTLMNTTFMPAAGNHDEDQNSLYEHFNVIPAPFSATVSGMYYSFDYANAHFIVLNTNEDSKAYADFTPIQIQWLKGDAAAAKANGTKWLIAVIHKGPYTTSNHAEDTDISDPANGVRALVGPLLNQLGVDLVLQGHDHIYARTKPIADGKALEAEKMAETLHDLPIEYAVKPAGTIYIIPATAGPKVYFKSAKMPAEYYELFDVADENHAAVYGPDPADASRPVRSAIQNFMGITIDGGKLTAVVYEIDQKKDPETPYIIDQFGIVK